MNTVTTITYDVLIKDTQEDKEQTILIELPYLGKYIIELKSENLDRIGVNLILGSGNYTQTLKSIKEAIQKDGYEIIEIRERVDSYPSKHDPDWVKKIKEQITPLEND
ncbi:hypothetical protein E0W68_02195 [Flavobacterium salilacus subsp. salilacus]|uniref:hypothetical protein n=1 Tax=Flavobacterium TaxID=237 RepID=UPI0010753FC4|nr:MULTISPECIES: hypothetical protein [Flavobacterium]KAF2520053.1 hypothetical protein E0W68_02195 [Flavobacterium salilacus subsp. salilacus]MBE1614031.1 hypothetical protein [Flavobacterium sp. SaA2.13]